jgi:hypothetical protein
MFLQKFDMGTIKRVIQCEFESIEKMPKTFAHTQPHSNKSYNKKPFYKFCNNQRSGRTMLKIVVP